MILDHVTDGANLLVKRAPPLDSEILRHCDLDALDVGAVPKRLKHGIGKAEEKQAMDWLFSKVVVYPKDPLLVEGLEQDLIERTRRRQVASEGLFNNDPGVAGTIRLGRLFHY